MEWLKRMFCKKRDSQLHEMALSFERAVDHTAGKQEDALRRIKNVTKMAALAQSGNCSIKKLMHGVDK